MLRSSNDHPYAVWASYAHLLKWYSRFQKFLGSKFSKIHFLPNYSFYFTQEAEIVICRYLPFTLWYETILPNILILRILAVLFELWVNSYLKPNEKSEKVALRPHFEQSSCTPTCATSQWEKTLACEDLKMISNNYKWYEM